MVLIIAAALTHPWWLPWPGTYLVSAEAPRKADAVIVLAGDFRGNRILKAAELVTEGFAPKVLVSGAPGAYGEEECDLAIRFAIRKGYPADIFEPLRGVHRSTQAEARVLAEQLKQRGIGSVLIVTSGYHTARAGRIWRRAAPWLQQRMVAVEDQPMSTWWKDREAAKHVFDEWSKSAALAFDFYTPVPGEK